MSLKNKQTQKKKCVSRRGGIEFYRYRSIHSLLLKVHCKLKRKRKTWFYLWCSITCHSVILWLYAIMCPKGTNNAAVNGMGGLWLDLQLGFPRSSGILLSPAAPIKVLDVGNSGRNWDARGNLTRFWSFSV